MKIWKDKEGKKLEPKEFFKRWKEGIEGITPLQQSKSIYMNHWIMIIGLLCGLYICLINLTNLWWLAIILAAGFINALIIQIGNYQKYILLKRMEVKYVQ